MKSLSLALTLFPLLAAANAMAMPHDQPELHFFASGPVSVGLVFSAGTDYARNPEAHRRLEEVYVCKNGARIADFVKFRALVDADGVMITAETQAGAILTLENDQDGIEVLESTLPHLKVEGTSMLTLPMKLSGISGFELDWSNPCAPKSTLE